MMPDLLPTLAIYGSAPTFPAPLHVGRPNIGDREQLLTYINAMLDRRWLTNRGPLVQEFEQRLAAYLGVKHCITTCNATVALEIAIRAAGLHGEVIVPSFTFVATAHALQWQAITPVFCDVDPTTHCINPRMVEALITPRTTGIIGVHVWGQACAIEELRAVADHHHLRLLFDAAHAFGCTHHGHMIGSFGDAEVFSFHATKFFNTFEGGAVTTNDDVLAAKIRLMTNFGFAGYDSVIYIGTNGKMSEVSAAMGLTGLDALDEFITVNRRNYYAYQQALHDIPGVHLLSYDEREQCNYQYIVAEINANEAGIQRDTLVKVLHAENVLARRYFYPGVHRMEPYRSYFPHAYLLLPETECLTQRVLILPTGTAVQPEDIAKIGTIIRTAVHHGATLEAQLAEPVVH